MPTSCFSFSQRHPHPGNGCTSQHVTHRLYLHIFTNIFPCHTTIFFLFLLPSMIFYPKCGRQKAFGSKVTQRSYNYAIPPPLLVHHKKTGSVLRFLYSSNMANSIFPEASSSISDYLTVIVFICTLFSPVNFFNFKVIRQKFTLPVMI